MEKKLNKKKAKVLFLFIIITFGFLIFAGTLLYWSKIDRRLPALQTSEKNSALRGNILSADGYTIATSQKLYKVMVDTRNIDKSKQDIFIKLYSIYAEDNPKRIKKLINRYRGNIILSYSLDGKQAKRLKALSRKLFALKVFVPYEDKKTKTAFIRGMDIVESGEKRIYPNKDILSPFVGYVKKIEVNEITKISGVKGIERFYEDKLAPIQDALIIGPKDIGHNVILNRDSIAKKRLDGFNITLSISLKLQKNIENILDAYKEKIDAKEMVAAVIKSDTGEFLALATSNRFDPNNIKRSDYKKLNATAIEHSYEPGSVMKTIILALLLREDKVNPYDMVNTYKGRYKLGKRIIRDTHDFEQLSAEDIIVHSSNIGILQLAQKLDSFEYYQGLKDFGLAKKTGIDLSHEKTGIIPSMKLFKNDTYKATVGYGYGLRATFMQILRAYNVFNDKGRLISPYIGVYLTDSKMQKHPLQNPPQSQVLPVSIAKRVKRILIKTVQKGTGKNAKVDGLEIGGKTGTAHIAVNGRYENIYNGSFFGFANDEKNRFTIGVLAIEPKAKYKYFGSQSAAPVFKKIVQVLVEENYLKPKLDENLTKS